MKKIIVVFFLVTALNQLCFSQWQWAKQIGGTGYDVGGHYLDASDNVICIGVCENNCYFNTDTFNASGNNDLFIAKYGSTGNEIWVKKIGGYNPTGHDEWTASVAIDMHNNDIYFTGSFYGTLMIDSITISSIGMLDIFVAKFDSSGNCQWLKNAGSNFDDDASTIVLDSDKNLFWTGILYNNGVVEGIGMTAGTFMAKIDSSGNILWVKNEMTNSYSVEMKVSNNFIYFCGIATSDTAIVDSINIISHGSNADCIFGKLDTSGSAYWVKRIVGNKSDYATDLEFDADSNLYLVGQFNDSLFLDVDTFSNDGKPDMFFAKFNLDGTFIWMKQCNADGTYGGQARKIAIDYSENFYVGGYFGGNAMFGSYAATSTSSSSKDMFVAKYDSAGLCLGIRHFGKAETNGLEIDQGGSLIISGDIIDTVNIGSTTLTSYGSWDMFFAKMDAITGIDEDGERNNNELIIYSNPNQGICNITIPEEFNHEKNLTLSIFDNTGNLIQRGTIQMNDEKIQVDLQAEARGIYNVILSNGKKSYGGKIIFE